MFGGSSSFEVHSGLLDEVGAFHADISCVAMLAQDSSVVA